MSKKNFLIITIIMVLQNLYSQETDKFQWLEDVDSKKSLDWVEQHNKETLEKLTKLGNYKNIYDKSLSILNSSDRIINPSFHGQYIYNFWQDKEHVRGIWRRTAVKDYINGKPKWDVLLDIDALSKKDDIKWVFKGASGLYPNYDKYIISLSKGGGDAVIYKEFDANKKEFIPNGFSLPESKGSASYWDENTLIVSTNFGEGTMTTSGYPKQVKLWKRGTDLKEATLLIDGATSDVSVGGYRVKDGDNSYLFINQGVTFYSNKNFIWLNNKLIKLDIPDDANINNLLNNQLIVHLKSDWKVNNTLYKQGTLISLNFTQLIDGKKEIQSIYVPDQFSNIEGVNVTKNKLLVNVLKNVKSELYVIGFKNGKWEKIKVPAPDFGTLNIGSIDEFSDQYFFYFQNFLTPSSLYFGDATTNKISVVKSLPAFFDSKKYTVNQYKAKSKDGTMIPYFVVAPKKLVKNSKNPTLLYAYGGFEASSLPYYSGVTGTNWLDNGGIYVLANIRGGGEYGPKWHQAGLKEKRQNIYDDFHAVAEDLIHKKITSSQHLGIMGGSNGGLLVGVAFTQRPDLYNAVVCAVPLLDMKRYNKLLAGASWMGEYGDPDKPEEWAFIQKYSPYHNLKENAKYPEVFFTTSTRDDRVHPGHARKMVAKMTDMGYKVYYFENTEGGHAGSSTNDQRARAVALQYAYLFMKLK